MKNKKQLFLSLCCALMFTALPVGAASCDKVEDIFGGNNKEEEKFDQYAGGEFYCGGSDEAASGANTLSLTSDEAVTLVINGETLTGTYKFKDDTFIMTFGEKTVTAKLTDAGVTVTYEGTDYAFIPKVNYTVTFKVGEETTTKTVVNGKTLSKPADPEVDGFMFMGWYADAAYTTSFNFNNAITSNVTVYAKLIELDESALSFNVKFMVDGVEAFDAVKTDAGIVLNLPTPEKEGATFAGWWVSATENANELTYKYEHQILKQDTTLFAVWEGENPLVSVNENGVTWTAKGVNNSYFVEIKNEAGEELDSGMTTMASYAFDFSSQPAGKYTVTVTSTNNQKMTVYYMNKALATVCNFVIEGSTLKFNAVENATKYLITSECGSSTHVHTDVDNGNSTVYDFSACHMKADGITFVVKAVADGYVTSVSKVVVFEQTLPAPEVSVDTATDFVSWNAVENATSYNVEVNGVVVKENITATSFDVRAYGVGALNVKVTANAHGWNSKSTEIVYNKTSLAVPANIKLETTTLTWDAVEGADSYRISIDGQEVVASSNSFDLSSFTFANGATSCSIKVKAISFDSDATHSVYSDTVVIQLGTMADTLTYAAGKVNWDAVVNVKGYEVDFNGTVATVDANQTSYALNFTAAGQNVVKVRCIKADDSTSDWVELYVTSYKTEFNVGGGSAVATVYAAAGDEVSLAAESKKAGYTFQGWFDTANGVDGIEYASKLTQGEADLVVYAHWVANKYKVSLIVDGQDTQVVEVTFDQKATLPIAESTTEGLDFGGWFTGRNGRGLQYTNEQGELLKVWRDTDNDVVLYPNWATNLTYQEVVNEETGEKAYQVVGGKDVKSLKSIRIPATYQGLPVVGIGSSAFESCKSLETIKIPDTIQYIDIGTRSGEYGNTGGAFRYCYALKNFEVYEVEGNHTKYYEVIGDEEKGENKVLVYNSATYGKELVYVSQHLTGTFVVPEGVQSIPVNCFYGAMFSKIVLPSTLTTIADYAFDEADATEIVFADAEQPLAEDGSNALKIGSLAFQACYFITEITLPARTAEVKSFEEIFHRCSRLQKVNVAVPTDAGKCVYSSVDGLVCNAAGNEILFCSRYRTGSIDIDAGVKTIAANAFNGCDLIEELTVHAFVTSIGESAFDGCSAMKKLTFEATATDGAITIADKAFHGIAISELTLPKNLASLGAYAFGKTSALTNVVVDVPAEAVIADAAFGSAPTSTSNTPYFYVTTLTIGKNAPKLNIAGIFGGEKLMFINIHEENANFMNDTYGVIYNKVVDAETGKAYPTEILFCPNSVEGDYVLPETITTIGANVFAGKYFKSVTIGANVTSIGASAFQSCGNLQTVVFANADAALTETNALTIGESAFDYCKQLTNIVLPKRLVEIGTEAFNTCKLTGEFVIPENVKTIGDKAFNGCSLITSIKLPKALETLGTTSSAAAGMLVFDGCALASITLDESNTSFKVIDGVLYKLNADGVPTELMYCPPLGGGKLVDDKMVVQVPATVTKVWAYAFKNVVNVDVVEFMTAEGVSVDLTITANAFSGSAIGSVVLPEGMTTIAASTFASAGIKSITIPSTVTSVGASAFEACTALETVVFAEGTEALTLGATSGKGPFYGCSSLKTVVLPERLTLLGYQTFYNCSSLESINIPAQIDTIWNQAFMGCKKLKNVTFDKNADGETALKEIKPGSFNGASSLTSLDVPNTVETIGSSAFDSAKITSFVVPAAVKELDQIFGKNPYIKTVTFAEGSQLEVIMNNAFLECTALESITIPSTVKTIGHSGGTGYFNVFKGCTNLKTVTFETDADGKCSLEKIGNNSFQGTALTEFNLPETTAETLVLEEALFSGCRSLTKVSLPAQVASFSGVFNGCISIKELNVPENDEFLLEDGIIYSKDKTQIGLVLKDLATEDLVIADGVTTIAASAFANQASLKSVSLPASIKEIGASAFANCVNLQSVTFRKSDEVAESMTILRDKLFQGCKSLTTITGIPSTVTSFGSYTFAACPLSADFAIPSQITSVGTYAFADSGIQSVVIPQGLTKINTNMFDRCLSLTSVTFAEGNKLTTIENNAFRGCKALTNFVVPDTVTKLGNYAFSESGIKTITMSKGMTTLGSSAFAFCTELTAIEIFDGITKLDYYMFDGCTSLKTVILPNSITSFQTYVFRDCTSLEEISLPEKMTALDEGGSSWKNSRTSYAFYGCTSLKTVHLNNVVKLADYAFYGCTALENIDLSKVTDMNDYVFAGCTSLKSVDLSSLKTPQTNIFDGCYNLETVTLGSQLESVGNYMFANCTKLQSVELPDTVTTVGSYAFQNCRALTEMVLPSKVVKINSYLFDGCVNLESVDVLGSVTAINDYAFRGCAKITDFAIPSTITTSLGMGIFAGTSIKSITIPKSYVYMGSSVASGSFAAGCDTLEEIKVEYGNAAYKAVDGVMYTLDGVVCALPGGKKFENDTFIVKEGEDIAKLRVFSFLNNIKKVILPDSMTTLQQNAFRDCYGLEEVVLGAGLTTINSYVFQDCYNLKKIAKADGTLEGITLLNTYAFAGCSSLESIVLPSTLTTAKSNVFSDSGVNTMGESHVSGLKEITIPASFGDFGTMFQKSSSLERVVLAEGLTKVPNNAFLDCPNLKEVVLPSTVTSIGTSSFSGCTSLVSIVIPEGVTSIGKNAFLDCAALTTVQLPSTLTTIDATAFSGCTSLSNIELPASLTSIGASAFVGAAFESIVIPEGVTALNGSVFSGCTNLKSVQLPSTLTSIGASTFLNCSSLTSIVIPESVTSIGANAFDGCTALASINLPESLTSIGASAFAGCTLIESVVIPMKATVGASAFAGWTADQTVYIVINEFQATSVWQAWVWNTSNGNATLTWNELSEANFVFNYTPTV